MKPIFFLELHMFVHIDNKQEIRKFGIKISPPICNLKGKFFYE